MLFERFIRNFYWHHAHGYSVSSESFRWADAHGTPQDLALLPGMRTDVSLSKQGFVLVIDAKYYLDTLQEYRGHATIRSAHLYQLYAYLANVERRASTPMEVEGLLIYPLTTRALHLDVRIHDRRMRVETLDLNQPWPRIHADLLALLPS